MGFFPEKPVISRFVAPWDTSGWYYMATGLQIGSRVYSNADIFIDRMPPCLLGCDYIVTYDSAADGFDDKQGVDFFVERAARVYVALDGQAEPAFLDGFEASPLEIGTDAGDVYRLYARDYAAGDHVHIPGFSGSGRHDFIIAQALDEDACREAATAERFAVSERHETPVYSWYVHDAFNRETAGCQPTGYVCRGDVSVQPYDGDPNRKYVRLNPGAALSIARKTTGTDRAEAALSIRRGQAEVCLGDVCVLLGEGTASLPDGTPLGDPLDGEFVVSFKRFAAKKQCEIWINCRPAAMVPSDCKLDADLSFQANRDGEIWLDRVDWQDQTDHYFVDESFEETPAALRASGETDIEIVHSVGVASYLRVNGDAAYSFPAVRGEARVEITVRPETADFTLLPEVRTSGGETLLRAAMYANNLFITNGDQWQRITAGYAPWQYYPCGNWYHITVAMNLRDKTFDVIVDGAVRARGFRLAAQAEDAAQIVFSGKLNVCRLKVLDGFSVSRRLLPPGPVFDVRDYGALGDGHTLDTRAIQRALDAAAYTNGTVVLQNGVFYTKQVNLPSDVTFWVDDSAVLLGSQQYGAYPHPVPGESLCAVRNVGRAVVYGERVRNVRLLGGGTLDANGRCRFKVNDPKGVNKLFTARPDNLYIAYSRDFTVADLHLRNAAYWTLVPLSSRHIVLEHLNLDCMNTPNRDGIDPVDCVDLSVRHCRIMAGDDGFCLKTADQMGCRNILAEDLMIQSLASGIKIGTDSYYAAENVTVRRCILKNVNRCGIAVESVDGASIRDLLFEDIDMTDCGGPIYLTIGHRGRQPERFPRRRGEMENLTFRRISYQKPYLFSHCQTVYESMIVGDPEGNPIRRVSITDCDFTLPGGCAQQPDPPQPIGGKYPEYDRHGLSSGAAFSIRYAEDIQIDNCRICLMRPDARPLIARHDT